VQLSVATVELVLLLNVPSAHAAHFRSLLAVAATVVWKPGAHASLTALHALPSSTSEKLKPALQPLHSRSTISEPSLRSPWPTGHVAHAVQLSVAAVELVLDLKVPSLQLSHARSLLAVAATAV
jgi:hypothetical protein